MKDKRYSYPIDVFDYDFENDSLLFNNQNIDYESSVDLGDIVLDIGVDGTPVGAEMLHASKLFGVSKTALKNCQNFKAEISISKDTIKIKITVSVPFRNGVIEKIAASQGINDINVPSAQIAMAC